MNGRGDRGLAGATVSHERCRARTRTETMASMLAFGVYTMRAEDSLIFTRILSTKPVSNFAEYALSGEIGS